MRPQKQERPPARATAPKGQSQPTADPSTAGRYEEDRQHSQGVNAVYGDLGDKPTPEPANGGSQVGHDDQTAIAVRSSGSFFTEDPDVATMLLWRKPSLVSRRSGDYQVRSAMPNEEFWSLWGCRKDALRSAGISVKRNVLGDWIVEWWHPVRPTNNTHGEGVRKAAERALAVLDNSGGQLCPSVRHLFDFQREAVRFGLRCWEEGRGVLLGDEMGLGKGVQTIALINADESIHRVLIICPNTLKINWHRELGKWLTRPLRVAMQCASQPWVGSKADIVVVNYDIVHRFEQELKATPWDLRVLDEAHYVKNHLARRTKFTLSIPTKRKVALTGTPIENRPVELFSIINDLDPSSWPRFSNFAHRYCGPTHNGYGWDYSGHSNEAELRQKLRSTLLVRRLKADVMGELPPKQHQIIELDSSGLESVLDDQRRQYDLHEKQLEKLRQRVQDAKISESADDYRAAVKALKSGQGARLEELARIRHQTALAKLSQVIAFCRDAREGGKIIIFAHHLDIISALKEAFPQAAVVTGRTHAKDRQSEVDRFQTDSACDVFLGNDAAGEGLTLTASSHVIFAETDWVPAKLAQKADRAHRIGQRGSVLCSYLVLAGSLDAEMMRTVVEKLDVINAVLDRPSPHP